MSLYPSPVRQTLDHLLAAYPLFDLVSIDWQLRPVDPEHASIADPYHQGPWVLIKLGQPSEHFEQVPAWTTWPFAIFKRTGALHTMRDGAVSDDPIWTP